jgi:hypothetical protein
MGWHQNLNGSWYLVCKILNKLNGHKNNDAHQERKQIKPHNLKT